MQTGDSVIVSPESPSGNPWPKYTGTIKDKRTGIKCIGSVEFLVESDSGHSKWVAERFIKGVSNE